MKKFLVSIKMRTEQIFEVAAENAKDAEDKILICKDLSEFKKTDDKVIDFDVNAFHELEG